MYSSVLSFVVILGAALFAPLANAESFSFTLFQAPGVDLTRASGTNTQGQIVGTGYTNSGPTTAYLYSNGVFTPVNPLGAGFVQANAINNSSQIAGTFGDAGGSHGYIDTNGTFQILDAPGAGTFTVDLYGTHASGINDAGEVAGYYVDDMHVAHAYLYSNGTFTTLNPPGGSNGAFATAINNAGQIVGYAAAGPGSEMPFLYSNGVYTILPIPTGSGFDPTGINDSGQIVSWDGFLLDPDGMFTAINPPEEGPPGAGLRGPLGINNIGQIVGSTRVSYVDREIDAGFLATPIANTPEPSSLSLAVVAILVGLCRLRSLRSRIESRR